MYGRSKLAGEREALALGPAAAVVRTSWVCGEHGNNMVKTVLRLARPEQARWRSSTTSVGHPTFTADLAPDAATRWPSTGAVGVHHVTNQGAVSWYEFVREILSAAGHDPDRGAADLDGRPEPPRPAPRPANSVLDNAVWRAAGLPPLRDFREPLAELVAKLA